jgi:2',3'-cyclic-nucleotide 2'-phosphodiesterase (5'-nucleotidase family)
MAAVAVSLILASAGANIAEEPAQAGLPAHGSRGPAVAGDVQLLMPLDSTGSDVQETSYGNVCADAVLAAGNADAAIVPADEFVPVRLDRGKHSVEELRQALSNRDDASDHVIVLSLTGEQLRQALNRSVSHQPLPFDGFLQVSGLKVLYNPTLAPGKQVVSVKLGGAALDPQRKYRVATTKPLANGSFGYFRVWDEKAIDSDTGVDIGSCLAQYLAAHRTIDTMIEGRISKE